MSTTLAHDKKSLRVLESFEVDWELPKWKNRLAEGSNLMMYNNIGRRNGGLNVISQVTVVPTDGAFISAPGPNGFSIGAGGVITPAKKEGFLERFFGRNKRQKALEQKMKEEAEKPNFTVEPLQTEDPPSMTVEEFFSSVKNTVDEIQKVNEKLESYTSALEKLKNLGQVALYEAMALDVEMYRAEAQLYAIGMTKYITEDNIVTFLKKSPKALRLDWIKNFIRIIPDEVAEKKIKADELNIFDNYVVLHYDPDNKGNQMTTEEIARKKDPILFGLVMGSRKLYYVGDWIDEYCDLTLEKVIEFLGEGSVKEITKETE